MTNHSDEDELIIKLTNTNIKVGDIYYHYKNPNLYYKIIAIALDEETEEPVIIYQAQYGKNLIWMRKIFNWNQNIESNGVSTFRFNKLI